MDSASFDLTVHPLTPDRWTALVDLFGASGGSAGCWCMYWRIGPQNHRRPRERNRDDLRQVVERGPAPGLLAFVGTTPVGWCQLTPRADLAWLERRRDLRRVDEAPVWSVSCFFVRRGYRRRGVMTALIAAALRAAKRAGAPAVEAYPVDAAHAGALSDAYTGTRAAFERAGFVEVGRRTRARSVMRHDLAGIES